MTLDEKIRRVLSTHFISSVDYDRDHLIDDEYRSHCRTQIGEIKLAVLEEIEKHSFDVISPFVAPVSGEKFFESVTQACNMDNIRKLLGDK